MNAVLTSTPPRTQAAILRRVLAERHPKFALGDIAHHFGLTMTDLQTMLRRYGYPDTTRMTQEAAQLELEAQERATADQVTPESDAGDAGATLRRVPCHQLLADPDNPREHLEDIDELADSIRSVGLLQPIVARTAGDRLYVVAGHRRLAAVRHLQWTDVPCIVRGPMRPDHVLAAMLIENGQRTDLDPIEEAHGLAKLKAQHGHTDSDLARMIGRSIAFVSNRLALLHLTADEQAEVRAGQLGVTHATRRGRLNAGKVLTQKAARDWHLSDTHDLAAQVKARCARLNHKGGRKIGAIGCGECWETVIRATERAALIKAFHDSGVCPTCGNQS